MAPVGLAAALACSLLLSSAFAPHSEAAVDCDKVKDDLSTCTKYLIARAFGPPSTCCTAMKAVNNAVGTQANRQDACECIRSAAGKTPAFRPDRAMGINNVCGVKIPFDVFINSGCSNVS